jgi:hypothetical protein
LLKAETILESQRVKILKAGKPGKIPDPEIHISSDIGPEGQLNLVLVKILPEDRRIVAGIIWCMIADIKPGGQQEILENTSLISKSISGIQERYIDRRVACDGLQVYIKVPFPVMTKTELLAGPDP